MSNRQAEIAAALDVVPPFADEAALVAEIERRKRFIKDTLRNAGLKVLVLGISGGVDSTTAGRLAQLSVEELACLVRGEGMCSHKVTPGVASAFGGVADSLLEKGIPLASTAR